jgi:hypothetical protein
MSDNLSVESLSTPEKLALMERLWKSLSQRRACLMNETPPAPATKCPHCSFGAKRLAYAAKAN